MRLLTACGLLVAALLAGSMVAPSPPAPPPVVVVVAFGDSLTAGLGAAPDESYPALLARDLGVAVLNAGVSGQTADEGLARLDRDVLAPRPTLVVVLFGANEALRGQPVATAIAGLDLILLGLRGQGIPVLLLGVQYHGFGPGFEAELRALAAKDGATFLPDVLAGVLDDPALTGDGGYHPNAAGYRVMEARIRPAVARLLAAPA